MVSSVSACYPKNLKSSELVIVGWLKVVFVDGGKNVTLVAKKFHGLSVGVKREEKCDAGTNAINEREKKCTSYLHIRWRQFKLS